MSQNIKRMSQSEAAAAVARIAFAYASAAGIEGKLLHVQPDSFSLERRGKTPVHWVAVFESVINGAVFDGPLIVCINLAAGSASPAA
jgi:hypothetical protein